jgi:hypothetical protein
MTPVIVVERGEDNPPDNHLRLLYIVIVILWHTSALWVREVQYAPVTNGILDVWRFQGTFTILYRRLNLNAFLYWDCFISGFNTCKMAVCTIASGLTHSQRYWPKLHSLQTARPRERQADRRTDRQTDRQRYRQRTEESTCVKWNHAVFQEIVPIWPSIDIKQRKQHTDEIDATLHSCQGWGGTERKSSRDRQSRQRGYNCKCQITAW